METSRPSFGRNQLIGIGIITALLLMALGLALFTSIPLERLQWWGDYTADLGPWAMGLILGPSALIKIAKALVQIFLARRGLTQAGEQ